MRWTALITALCSTYQHRRKVERVGVLPDDLFTTLWTGAVLYASPQLRDHVWTPGFAHPQPLLSKLHHRAEFSDTSGTFSFACSAKFEIARVKRRETIKKMAENGATSTSPCLFSFYTALWSIRYTRAFKEEAWSFYSKHFSKPFILDKVYQTDVENSLVLLVICMKYWLH